MSLDRSSSTHRAVAAHSSVVVDRIRCSGHGICAQTLPGAVTLDEWGYPTLTPSGTREPVTRAEADVAIALCPARALSLPRPAR